MIEAAILAGGLGTRLRAALGDRPKALAPVAGRPFLSYVLDRIAAAGVRRAVLCTGYLGEQIEAAFGDRYGDIELVYSRETAPRGTAGALHLALPLLKSDPVLVLNGDSHCDVDPADLIAWQRRRDTISTGSLLVTWVEDAARYGSVDLADDGSIVAFREKDGVAMPGWINAGVYLLSRGLLMSIPDGVASLEHDVLPRWVGCGLDAYAVKAPFVDIGTAASYADAEALLRARNFPRRDTGIAEIDTSS